MCGIIGYAGFQDPKGILLDGLKRLEYRGYDSAGIAIRDGSKVELFRVEGRLKNLEEKLGSRHFHGFSGIGHTRWATHGAPTEINAHPHRVGNITLVHNGIIENYTDHRDHLLKLGRQITSDTDTEIVAHLLDIELKTQGTLERALCRVLPKLRGSYAFVIMNDEEPDLIIGVRNGAPLLAGVGKNENFIASDVQAILHRTKQIIYLKDHQFAVCKKDGVFVKDEEGRPISPEIKTVNWTPEQMDKLGYPHYMLKEIHEQPQAIANTVAGKVDHGSDLVSLPELLHCKELLRKIKKISIVACGTARHAALVGQYYIERFARLPVSVDFASEFRYRDPILDDDSLLVLVSQSGETADTLAAQKEGQKNKIKTLSICNVRESTLTRESSIVIYTNAGPEIGVASTKAFTTQLTILYMLAVQLGLARETLSDEQGKELTNDLYRLPLLLEKTLELEDQVKTVAEQYHGETFFFYIARGINYPIALEGALKLKEISYIHAEGYPAGELKHGPIALVDKNAVIVVFAPLDESYRYVGGQIGEGQLLYEKLMSNVQEVKARAGRIVAVGTENDHKLAKESKYFIGLPKASWGLNPILSCIPMQLLAYHIAHLRGTDVDKPRNLAKSVTVE